MRLALLLCACALACTVTAAGAATQTWFGFQVGVSGGAPPPFAWRAQPHVVVVDAVQVVSDDRCDEDVFSYGGAWWRMRGGWWFRSATWRGPWRAVDVRVVPGPVLRVPAERWKHRPPGLARAEYVHARNQVRREERREDRREDRRHDRHDDWRDDHHDDRRN